MAALFFPRSDRPRATPASRDGENAVLQAVFGSVDFDITDTLCDRRTAFRRDETTLGRWSTRASLAPRPSIHRHLPRAILEVAAAESTNVYLSWSKGVLPGQFNTQYITAPAFQRAQIEAAFPGVSETAPSQEIKALSSA